MTPENFVYWMQGFLEIGKPTSINAEQIEEIKNHIALVLLKETPAPKFQFINGLNNTPVGTGISFTPGPTGLVSPPPSGPLYGNYYGGVNPNSDIKLYVGPHNASC